MRLGDVKLVMCRVVFCFRCKNFFENQRRRPVVKKSELDLSDYQLRATEGASNRHNDARTAQKIRRTRSEKKIKEIKNEKEVPLSSSTIKKVH